MTTAKIRARSESLLAEGKLQQAGDIVSEALALQPHDAHLILAKAGVMVAGKQFRQAVETLRGLLKRKPDLADGWYLLGNCYRALTQFHDAKEAYRKVIRLNENYPGVFHFIGFCCQQLGDLNGAESGYRKALEQFDDPHLHFRLGNLLHRAGRIDEGIASFREVLQRQPDHQQALSAITIALLDEKQDVQALEAAREHVRRHPGNAMALVNLTYAAHLAEDPSTVTAILDYDAVIRDETVGVRADERERIASSMRNPQLPPEAEALVKRLDIAVDEFLGELRTHPLPYWSRALPEKWQTRYSFLPIDNDKNDFPHCHPQAIAAGTYLLTGSGLRLEFGRGDEVYRGATPPQMMEKELTPDMVILHPAHLMYQVLPGAEPCVAIRCEVFRRPGRVAPGHPGQTQGQ